MTVIALVGGFTAFMAATMGLVMNDIKRVMAYSTISQLGYMMAALGMGAYGAALFHLFTHAFFKALLFLCAGSVNHASGTFNMRYMGGLRRQMPWTYLLMVIGGLSLVGIVPLAGFWSKDEILLAVWLERGNPAAQATFVLLIVGVLLTAFYTFRMIFLTFHGQFRGGGEQELRDAEETQMPLPSGVSGQAHLAESPLVMLAPMAFLGFFAVVAGYLANPQWSALPLIQVPKHWITEFLVEGLAFAHPNIPSFSFGMALVSTVVALVGIGLASLLYARKQGGARELSEPLERARPLHVLLTNKYYLDYLYEDLIVRRWFYRGLVAITDWIDRTLVDGFVDLLGGTFRTSGRLVTALQTGQVQFYGTFLIFGALVILVAYLIFGTGIRS
jgi:NADH-quinone oxidoreductase subunit L